jgi:hypothetical protein
MIPFPGCNLGGAASRGNVSTKAGENSVDKFVALANFRFHRPGSPECTKFGRFCKPLFLMEIIISYCKSLKTLNLL